MSESKTFVIQKKKKKNSILNLLGRKKSFVSRKIFFLTKMLTTLLLKNICCGEIFSIAQLLHRRNKYFRTKKCGVYNFHALTKLLVSRNTFIIRY